MCELPVWRKDTVDHAIWEFKILNGELFSPGVEEDEPSYTVEVKRMFLI